MVSGVNQKIIGAIVVGGALVAGAYTLATFGVGKPLPAGAGGAVQAPARVAIKVEDKDQNGVEDWRDSFFMEKPVILGSTGVGAEYTYPTTFTGRVGISLVEESIRSKYSVLGTRTNADVANDALSALEAGTKTTLYDTKDITIMETWTDNDIKTYANTMGQIILNGKSPTGERETEVLKDIMLNGKRERIAELHTIAQAYGDYREQSLALPVPKPLAKQHLDLINTYAALEKDVLAFSQTEIDPLLSLTHLQKYPDDAVGLALALRNFSTALDPYTNIFTTADSASIFTIFDPNYQKP